MVRYKLRSIFVNQRVKIIMYLIQPNKLWVTVTTAALTSTGEHLGRDVSEDRSSSRNVSHTRPGVTNKFKGGYCLRVARGSTGSSVRRPPLPILSFRLSSMTVRCLLSSVIVSGSRPIQARKWHNHGYMFLTDTQLRSSLIAKGQTTHQLHRH